MAEPNGKTVQITARISERKYESLKKLAASKHINMADVVRGFIDKGLSVQGYEDNLDFLTGIIRQEIKAESGKQANRLAAMFFKVGIITSANYFLAVKMLSDVINPSMQEDFKDINANARKLGIDYMKQNGLDAVGFLKDAEAVERATDKLRTDFTGR